VSGGRAAAQPIAHGGSLIEAARLYPEAPRPFLDLSTGINPSPYRLLPADPALGARLPEPDDLATLEEAAAQAYGCRDPGLVVAAPGTQILISLLPHLLRPARATVLAPTYGEHARAWQSAGVDTLLVADPAEFARLAVSRGGAAVLCNPNNPDGRLLPAPTLLALAGRMAAAGGWLLVDEAFADLEQPDPGLAPALPHGGLVLLRSFGKSYGLAGLRLGFLLAEAALGGLVRAALGPWAVSSPALAAGLAALPDSAWRAASMARLAEAARRLDWLAGTRGLALIGGTRLFRLYASPDASALRGRLGRSGILVRGFSHDPRLLRFGLPGAEADWRRLEDTLTSI